MKVSDLKGAQLDYWVAKAEGATAVRIIADEKGSFALAEFTSYEGTKFTGPYFPSTEWSDGGPIIERERIIIGSRQRMADSGRWAHLHWTGRAYHASNEYNDYAPGIAADTALTAAMRAYVASTFGEEVPDEVAEAR